MNKYQTPPLKNNNYQPTGFCPPFKNSSNITLDIKNNKSKQRRLNKYIITSKKVTETFQLFAIDQKYLNKHEFNEALEYLFSNIPIPALHHTYLSNKLFEMFNLSGNSKLNEDEFMTCIKQILSNNKDKRLHLSMMAMMTYPKQVRKSIDLDELKKFFYESFVQGYKHMAWKINEKPDELKLYGFPVPSIKQIEAWAREFERKIKNGFEKDLKMFDSNINETVTFEQYRKWLDNDQTLYIKYGFKTFMIATSLIIFDDVQFQEN